MRKLIGKRVQIVWKGDNDPDLICPVVEDIDFEMRAILLRWPESQYGTYVRTSWHPFIRMEWIREYPETAKS